MKKKILLLSVALALVASCNRNPFWGNGSGNVSLSGTQTSSSSGTQQSTPATSETPAPPVSTGGYQEVNFNQASPVKNVTQLGEYLGGIPTTGDVNVLVLPVEFSDKKATSRQSLAALDNALNAKSLSGNQLSVAEYYRQSSYGKLNLTFDLLGGGQKFYQPSKPSTEYINNGGAESGRDIEIIDDILKQADSTVDYTKYDRDGNGAIDAVVVVPVLDIDNRSTINWAYRFWAQNNIKYDNELVNDYLWCPFDFLYDSGDGNYNNPTPTVTYTLIHEFGHVLGADDYYDTSYSTQTITETPMKGEDVMDAKYGDHNPYTKFNYGWIDKSRYVDGSGDSVTLNLAPFETDGDTIIVSNNFDVAKGAYQEYWVMMYYSKTGINANSDYVFGKGLVIYHVNATLTTAVQNNRTYYVVANNNDLSGQYKTPNRLISLALSRFGNYTLSPSTTFIPRLLKDDSNRSFPFNISINTMTDSSLSITFSKA